MLFSTMSARRYGLREIISVYDRPISGVGKWNEVDPALYAARLA